MSLPEGINRLVGMGGIRHQTFDESDVAALWNKAVSHAADAKLAGMSLDGATNSGYSAVMEAAMAVMAHHGLRAGNVRNHHEMIFSALDAFEISGLEDLVADSTKVRSYRKGALYDPDIATQKERDETLAWMDATLPILYSLLVELNPGLHATLTEYK